MFYFSRQSGRFIISSHVQHDVACEQRQLLSTVIRKPSREKSRKHERRFFEPRSQLVGWKFSPCSFVLQAATKYPQIDFYFKRETSSSCVEHTVAVDTMSRSMICGDERYSRALRGVIMEERVFSVVGFSTSFS
jgi:hypothetical protein